MNEGRVIVTSNLRRMSIVFFDRGLLIRGAVGKNYVLAYSSQIWPVRWISKCWCIFQNR